MVVMNETYEYNGINYSFTALIKVTGVHKARLREMIKKSKKDSVDLNILVILFHHDRRCDNTYVVGYDKEERRCLTRGCDKTFRKESRFHKYCSACAERMDNVHVSGMEERLNIY